MSSSTGRGGFVQKLQYGVFGVGSGTGAGKIPGDMTVYRLIGAQALDKVIHYFYIDPIL
jgi:hypothetical protein